MDTAREATVEFLPSMRLGISEVDPDGNSPLLIIPAVMIGSAIISGAINAYIQHETTGTIESQGIGGVLDAAGDGAMFGMLAGGAAVASRTASARTGGAATRVVAESRALSPGADNPRR